MTKTHQNPHPGEDLESGSPLVSLRAPRHDPIVVWYYFSDPPSGLGRSHELPTLSNRSTAESQFLADLQALIAALQLSTEAMLSLCAAEGSGFTVLRLGLLGGSWAV